MGDQGLRDQVAPCIARRRAASRLGEVFRGQAMSLLNRQQPSAGSPWSAGCLASARPADRLHARHRPWREAFVVAQRFPICFARSLPKGVQLRLRAAFARRLEGEGPGAAHRFAERGLFGAARLAGGLHRPRHDRDAAGLMYVIAPGFVGDAQKFDLAVDLTRIAFPYLLFMSLTALQIGRAQQPQPLHRGGGGADPAQLCMIAPTLWRWRSAPATRRRPAISWPGALRRRACCNSCCWRSPAGAPACRSCRAGRA